jgi:hypothetical protein
VNQRIYCNGNDLQIISINGFNRLHGNNKNTVNKGITGYYHNFLNCLKEDKYDSRYDA